MGFLLKVSLCLSSSYQRSLSGTTQRLHFLASRQGWSPQALCAHWACHDRANSSLHHHHHRGLPLHAASAARQAGPPSPTTRSTVPLKPECGSLDPPGESRSPAVWAPHVADYQQHQAAAGASFMIGRRHQSAATMAMIGEGSIGPPPSVALNFFINNIGGDDRITRRYHDSLCCRTSWRPNTIRSPSRRLCDQLSRLAAVIC